MTHISEKDLKNFPKCWGWMHDASARIQRLADFVRQTGDQKAFEDALEGLKLYKGMARHLAIEETDELGRQNALVCYKEGHKILLGLIKAAGRPHGLVVK